MKTVKIFSVMVLLIALFVGCSKNAEVYEVFINDEAGILNNYTENYIKENIQMPGGVPLMIRTIESVESNEIASIAANLMEEEEVWADYYPKGFFGMFKKKPGRMGIYVLISTDPELIQLRFGSKMRLYAFRNGFAAGNEYREMQENYIESTYNQGLIDSMEWLETRVTNALDVSFFIKMVMAIPGSEVIKSTEDFVVSSGEIYVNWLFKPFLVIGQWAVNLTGRFWILPLVFALIFQIVSFIILTLFFEKILFKLMKLGDITSGFIINILEVILGLVIAAPAFGSMILFFSGRMEDELFLNYLGFQLPDQMLEMSSLFAMRTGLVIAMILAVVIIIKSRLDRQNHYVTQKWPPYFQRYAYYLSQVGEAKEDKFAKKHSLMKMMDFAFVRSAMMSKYENMSSTDDDLAVKELKARFEEAPYKMMNDAGRTKSIKSAMQWVIVLQILPRAVGLYALIINGFKLLFSLIKMIKKYPHNKKVYQQYEEFLAAVKSDTNKWLSVADNLYKNKQYNESRDLCNLIYDGVDDPDQNFRLLFRFGMCFYQTQNYDMAVESWQLCLKLDSENQTLIDNINIAKSKLSDKSDG